MKRIFTLILFAAFLLAGVVASAQITHGKDGSVDQIAKKVLSKASDKFNGSPVSFKVTMVNKNSKKKETARQTATVLYSKGKYRVSLDGQTIYCDGKSVWVWNKQSNECMINKQTSAEDDLMNPATLLSHYSVNYKAKYIRTESNGSAIIDLTPKKGRSYYKIRLTVNTNNNVLQSMEIHNYDSSCGEYHLSNFKSGVAASNADFVFPAAKNPKVELIDMR